MRLAPMSLALAILVCLAAPARGAVTASPIHTFDNPMYVTAPAGDAHRLFVAERFLDVRIVRDGTLLDTPFLDLSNFELMHDGITSMAFAPDYAETGRFYVLYEANAHNPDNAQGVRVRLDEFTRGSDPDQADPSSRRNLLDLDFSDATDHEADHIAFGPDGHLYMTIGEGLTGFARAQDPSQPRGKLLRIDPLPDGSKPYGIPADNPFVAGGGMPEVFAYGLRNPWRFGFDWDNGAIAIGDVGDSTKEELDLLSLPSSGGTNLGWPCWEGTSPHNSPCDAPGAVFPFFEYGHTNGRCSIIAGDQVRDPTLPTLLGRFVYGDFCTGEVRSLALSGASAPDDQASGVTVSSFNLSSFGTDGCGRLYVVETINGNVSRLDDEPRPPCVLANARPLVYREGDPPADAGAGLELGEVGSSTISGATVAIASGFAAGEDELSFTPQAGIGGSYDSSTGVLTLSGDAPPSDYESALRSVRYQDVSNAPSTADRRLEIRATDASARQSPAATRTVEVRAVDQAPAIATSAPSTVYRGSPVAVDSGLEVSDPDDANLEGAAVRIVSGFQAGDRLTFAGQAGIAGSYDSGTGVLTLRGSAPVASYRAALRGVRFDTTKPVRSPARTVAFRVGDGELESGVAEHRLDLVVDTDGDGRLDQADNCPRTRNPGQLDRDGDGRGAACDPFDPAPGACANPRRGTPGADRLFGTRAGDRILGLGGADVLVGRRGGDCLLGSDGPDRLAGGRGDDELEGGHGDDELDGGRGGDRLRGGRGGDHLIGDRGVNEYRAGAGDDRIEAANGVPEDVRCGSGRDRATVDPADRTTACERVVVPLAR